MISYSMQVYRCNVIVDALIAFCFDHPFVKHIRFIGFELTQIVCLKLKIQVHKMQIVKGTRYSGHSVISAVCRNSLSILFIVITSPTAETSETGRHTVALPNNFLNPNCSEA